jgi:hypothetical protein
MGFCAGAAFAQQAITSATLGGRVEDSSGAAVAGAELNVEYIDRAQTFGAVTDGAGRFQFLRLAPGLYSITVEHPGFEPYRRRIALSAGQALDLRIALRISAGRESIQVVDAAPVVEAARTSASDRTSGTEIQSLPLNGRNYMDLALLSPGVSRTNLGAPQPFAETSATPGTGLSVSGQRNLNNNFVVDGLSANDDAAGLAGTYYSAEVVREFEVITSGSNAEFGRASAGVVSVATRSGTNEWRGSLYAFLRNSRLDARNALATRKDPLTQTTYGASAGGPLAPARRFLFTNFEQTRRHAAGVIAILPANAATINSALTSFGLKGSLATGEYPTGWNMTNLFARIDQQLAGGHQVMARFGLYDISSENARNVGSLNAVSRGTALFNRDISAAFSDIRPFSARTLNEARLQYVHSRLDAPANDPTGPAVNISGVANFGASTTSPTGRYNDLYEASDSVSLERGAHFFKAGASVLWNRLTIAFPGALAAPVYTFPSLSAFQSGRYATFQQAFGDPNQFQSNPNLGLFAQDQWKPHPDVTIDLGVRYDVQFLPRPIETYWGNAGPRAGVAWSPADRRTVIRASYGLFYDRIPLRATSNALQRDGSKYRLALLAFGQAGAPTFPQALTAFPPGQYINITTIDPSIRSSYSHQANFQIERRVGAATFMLGYQWVRALHLILSRNVNVPTLSAADAAALGVPNLGRPDPRYGNVSRYESSGDSYFNGLLASVRTRLWGGAQFRLSYTLSKAIDDIGNFFFSTPQDNNNLRDDRGLSDNDQRHRVSAAAVVPVGAWELSTMLIYTSALPFNVQLGYDRNNDTNLNDRPVGVGRNTGRGFNFFSLDARVSRSFKIGERWRIQALAEMFNTLNRANLAAPNNIIGPNPAAPLASFGAATAAYDPRQAQIGLRLQW